MGGKSQPQMPPPVDNQAEKKKMIGTKKKGMYGTIMTGGEGVEEEATTSQSLLGGKK